MKDRIVLADLELLYAATGRCRCGAGLAYPLDHERSMMIKAWVCSAVLKGDGLARDQTAAVFTGGPPIGEHDNLPWTLFKIREETSINNTAGHTTRPAGTVARTIGKAKCPKCQHTWESEPYSACGASHHWLSGPCPGCGYAVGSGTSWSTRDGEPIEKRYPDVVLVAP